MRKRLPIISSFFLLVLLMACQNPIIPGNPKVGEPRLEGARATSGITVYTPSYTHIYWWNSTPANSPANATWPGLAMGTDSGSGYKTYTFPNATAINLIFSNNGAGQTANLSRTTGSWLYSGGAWSAYTPGPAGITVYTKNNTHIYWWNSTPANSPANATWPGLAMANDPSGWKIHSFPNASAINLIFSNSGAGQSPDLTRSTGTWWYLNGTWFASNPETAPAAFDWKNALIYYVMTDRYVDGLSVNNHSYGRELNQDSTEVPGYKAKARTFHGGDFKGLTDKINANYFNNLGVTALWVTSPYEQIHGWVTSGSQSGSSGERFYSFHGYWPLDFTQTDANFGTAAEFQTFVDAAHSHGLRVVMDVVMNHAGYISPKDMSDLSFGTFKNDAQGHSWTWFYYNNALDGSYTNDQQSQYMNFAAATQTSWGQWYGASWIRAGLPGYEPLGGTGYVPGTPPTAEQFLKGADQFGLPDFKTETTTAQSLPILYQNKWGPTKVGTENSALTSFVSAYAADLGTTQKTVRVQLIKWLTDWVEKYGIDGFRCDTAAHVEKSAWKSLKLVAQKRFDAWKAANPAKKLDDTPFWMVGEGGDGDPPATQHSTYYDNGFDAMINFDYFGGFPGLANQAASAMNGLYQSYSQIADANPMSMISNHDYGVYYKTLYADGITQGNPSGNVALQKKAGTLLLLTPKTVNILYGDERAREPGTWADRQSTYRSDFEQAADPLTGTKLDILNHWKKLGLFRKAHPAIGAGAHAQINASPYTFSRVLGTDKVVCVIGASGSTTVNVSSVFPSGTVLKDAYSGAVATVNGANVTFTADTNGVILIQKN